VKDRIIDGLAAATITAAVLHSPTIAQPFTEEAVGITVRASHENKEIEVRETSFGTIYITIDKICDDDLNGWVDVGMRATVFDPKKGSLWMEAHHIGQRGINAEAEAEAEVKDPTKLIKVTLKKDLSYMMFIKEKIGSKVNTVKEFDLAHYCRERVLPVVTTIVEYSENFQAETYVVPNSILGFED